MSTLSQPQTMELIEDVWSRTAPKYRRRAIILLVANMILFGALCCFMFWLRTGWYFPPTYEHYPSLFWNTLNVGGDQQVTLQDLLLNPINLKLVPMQALVIGLLISALVSVPILITILYRLPCSIPFCAMVSFLAVMPWLGATLLLSCVIVSYTHPKIRFRFAAALLGLIPIGVYFFTASQRWRLPTDVLTPQMERGLVVVPLLLSAVGSCALMAFALALSRLVNYRPGVIAPLLALMFLMPWFFFISKVGRDELHYRFLEMNYGPQSKAYFAPTNPNRMIRMLARRMYLQQKNATESTLAWEQKIRQYFDLQLDPQEARTIEPVVHELAIKTLASVAKEQFRVAAECDKFLSDFPQSRYIPSVLFMKGRALDTRVDLKAFYRLGVLRFYTDFPSQSSRATWNTLVQNYSDSPLANVGRYRLAQLDARAGKIEQALAWVNPPTPSTASHPTEKNADQSRSLESLLKKKSPEASLEKEYISFPTRIANLQSLLQKNRDPATTDQALIEYFNCDARHERYHENLKNILQRFPSSKLEDNIQLQLALTQNLPLVRIAELKTVAERFPRGDALAEVLYELGQACIKGEQWTEARNYFNQLVEKHPRSSFAAQVKLSTPFQPYAHEESP